MTWEELCEKAEEMGAEIYIGCFIFKGLEFTGAGEIILHQDTYDINGNEFCACVAEDLEYKQMYQIMEALR